MSVQAIAWVLDHSRSRGTARLVLISIANHAHADGTGTWPSLQRIADEAGIDIRTVRRRIRDLESIGELQTEHRPGRSNSYRMTMETPVRLSAPDTPVKLSDRTHVSGVPRTTVSGEPSLEPSGGEREEPLGLQLPDPSLKKERQLRTGVHVRERFEEFWLAYPRRVAKGAARRAWDKRVALGASPDSLIEGARRYAAWCEEGGVDSIQFVAHPATWLNAVREDDELPDPRSMRRRASGGRSTVGDAWDELRSMVNGGR